MKISFVFLLVALSCCFENPAAFLKNGKQTRPARPDPDIISADCLTKVLKSSLPNALDRLQKMLCCFSKAKKENNAELYRQFLTELHTLLKDAGCAGDELLKLEGCLEMVGDKLGDASHKLAFQVLTAVEDLGLTEVLFEAVCKLAGDVIITLRDALKGLNLNGLTGLTSQLGVGGKGGTRLGIL